MQLNAFQLFMIAGAVAQAIQQQQSSGSDNRTKRANAVKIVITAVQPMVPAVRDNPEVAEHIGVLIDDFVRLSKAGASKPSAAASTEGPHA